MRAPNLLPILVILVLISGCVDGRLDAPPRGTILLDLQNLQNATSDGAQVVCATTAQEAVLLVEDRRNASLPITGEVSSLAFEDVEVRAGTVRFDVDIRSSTDARLYSGGRSVQVTDDGFQVGISLERQNGVLRVCPAEQQAFRFGAELLLQNIGNRPMTVDLPTPPSSCSGPCYTHAQLPPRFDIAPGQGVPVGIRFSELASGPYSLRFNSNLGHTDVVIRVN